MREPLSKTQKGMSSWYGTGMFHLVLHREALIKAKGPSEADSPGCSHLGESGHKKCV